MAQSFYKDAIVRQLAEARAVVVALEEVLDRARRLGAEKDPKKGSKKEENKETK